MNYESPPVGNEISCVFHGVSDTTINNHQKIKKLLLEALKKDNFNILRVSDYEFHPRGYTIAVLIGESHAAIHTYPEHHSIYFSIYSCRGLKDAQKTFEFFKKGINPSSVDFIERPVIIKNGYILPQSVLLTAKA